MMTRSSVLVRSDWVAQHVARGVGHYELPTYFVQRATIVIGDSYDVALRPVFPYVERWARDHRSADPTACPSRALRQMSRQLNAPARYVGGDALPLLVWGEDQIGKPSGTGRKPRVPLADGTLVPTSGLPPDDLFPSLLTTSDVPGAYR
jgi:hypothetical protein